MTVEPEALALIAQQSSGSLRDALGILDQVRAFSGEVITSDEVRSSVGIGRPATIAALTSHIISGDAGAALQLINHETGFGVDPRTLGRQLIEYWRVLLLHVVGAGAET